MAPKSSGPDPQNGRNRLIETAIRLFSRDGFDGTSVRSVADEAGVAWSLVRFHFGSKDGLRDAAEKYVMESYLGMVKAGASVTSIEELDSVIEAQAQGLSDIAGFLRRAITEQRPFALDFIRNLIAEAEAETRLDEEQPHMRGESFFADPVRGLSTRLGYILIAPQVAELLGRDLFSVEEIKRRNAHTRRINQLIELGLQAERARGKG